MEEDCTKLWQLLHRKDDYDLQILLHVSPSLSLFPTHFHNYKTIVEVESIKPEYTRKDKDELTVCYPLALLHSLTHVSFTTYTFLDMCSLITLLESCIPCILESTDGLLMNCFIVTHQGHILLARS